jgi:hypothetical protein
LFGQPVPFPTTGIDEIDEIIREWFPVVSESFSFSRSFNLNRAFGITETEIKWSCVFLNAFGVPTPGGLILVAPLIFARRTVIPDKAVSIQVGRDYLEAKWMSNGGGRNEELLVYNGNLFSDSHALIFHGSWISDDSIHRGKILLTPPHGENNSLAYWFSNIEEESRVNRQGLLASVSGSSPFKPYELVLNMLRQKLDDLVDAKKQQSQSAQIERIRFVYISGLLSEIAFFENELNIKKAAILDL